MYGFKTWSGSFRRKHYVISVKIKCLQQYFKLRKTKMGAARRCMRKKRHEDEMTVVSEEPAALE
jgi:hypothetical protein